MLQSLKLILHEQTYAICKLDPDESIPNWITMKSFSSITRTHDELSLVCDETIVPHDIQFDPGWNCFELEGPFDFSDIGILHSLSKPLTKADIPIFVISSYLTDFLLIKNNNLPKAIAVLEGEGFSIIHQK
jgi:hypothetical protein